MKHLKKIGLAAALMAAAVFAPFNGASKAQAAPASVMAQAVAVQDLQANSKHLQKVGKRGKYWKYKKRHHRRRHVNPGVAIGLGIIGALIAQGHSEAYARSAMERCDDRYRSFEWDTGYYTTYSGYKRLCPYLR